MDSSLALFRDLYQNDPYRLDNWDVYSHLLYLKEKRMELANLAQKAVSIDKYRVETCCVIGIKINFQFYISVQQFTFKRNHFSHLLWFFYPKQNPITEPSLSVFCLSQMCIF